MKRGIMGYMKFPPSLVQHDYVIHELKIDYVTLDPPRDSDKLCILLKLSFVLATCFSDIEIVHKIRSERF